MKKLFVFMFVICTCFGFAQTKPSYLQLKDQPIHTIREYGVKGDGTNEYNKVKSAIEAGGVLIVPADMTITVDSPAVSTSGMTVAKSLILTGGGTFKQSATPASTPFAVLHIIASGGMTIAVDGINFDANNKAANGLCVQLPVASTGGIASVRNCSAVKAQDLSAAQSSIGIWVYGMWDTVNIENNSISNIVRGTAPSSVALAGGISVSESLGNVTISGNKIDGVISNAGIGWVDADGISVFTRNHLTTADPLHSVVIRDNFVKNCSGRWVKLQTPGAKVISNTFRNDTVTTMTNFTGVDVQAGRCDIIGNTIIVTGGVTVGSSSAFVNMQGIVNSKRVLRCNDNTFHFTHATSDWPYGVIVTAPAAYDTAETVYDIVGNVLMGDIITTVYCSETATSTRTFPVVTKVDSNVLSESTDSRNLLALEGAQFGGAVAGDKYTWIVTNNSIRTPSTTFNGGRPFLATNGADRCGWLKLANNSGWANGARYSAPALYLILPGSDFWFDGDASHAFSSEIGSAGVVLGYQQLHIKRGENGITTFRGNASSSTALKYVNAWAPITVPSASWTYSVAYP